MKPLVGLMSTTPEAISSAEVDLGSRSVAASDSPVVLISIMTETRGGHFVHYHMMVGRVTRALGWRHVCAVDEACTTDIPQDWMRCLKYSHDLKTPGVQPMIKERRFLSLLRETFHALRQSVELGRSIRNLVLQVTQPGERAILFMEWFNPFHLLALWIGIIGTRVSSERRVRPACWIMFRYIYDLPRLHMLAHKIVLTLIDRVIGRENLKILAEWEQAASQYATFFRRNVTVVPLWFPWAGNEVGNRKREGSVIVCWWPGIPSPRKGSATIRLVTTLADERSASDLPIELHAAESLGAQSPADGVMLVTHEPRMSTEAYVAQMNRTDIVLLPYESVPYATITSGIFMEAVMSERVPLVTANTTMASELLRYGLGRYVVDWTASTFWRTVREVFADEELRTRLAHMRRDYAKRFSDERTAEWMRKLVEGCTFR